MEPFRLTRRAALLGAVAAAMARPACAKGAPRPEELALRWYKLILELVRHTATYSPPFAARAFGYLGVTLWEVAARSGAGRSLAGQLNGLAPLPSAPAGLNEAAMVHGALSVAIVELFGNTGPTGQRAMAAMARQLNEQLDGTIDPALAALSRAHGEAVAAHILRWSRTDGGVPVVNLGFPMDWTPGDGPAAWQPTNQVQLQQAPLLPQWGNVRPFAMTGSAPCGLPPPPAYSTDPGSAFHKAAREVYDVSKSLTDEQKLIARFWSDDPMLSPTPPGHWISMLIDIADRDGLELPVLANALARLGIGMADAFIACWRVKYEYDLLRPVTYIRRHIDPTWEPFLITPPFPEYPSGHSTQSGAAAGVLTAIFGPDFAFDDRTHEDDGLGVRRFASFDEAAREAAVSRLYGGMHYRFGNEAGLDQGACVAAFTNALVTL
ncbi:MAG: vanadium-dependent haloperoxidase [Roseinatronobacter sp.]